MAVNPENVWTGGPDQDVTGAVSTAPVGVDVPTGVEGPISDNAKATGYLDEDGLTLSLDESFVNIPDWSGNIVRKVKESFDGTLAYNHLELNAESLRDFFGDANVDLSEGTNGKQLIKVQINGQDLPIKARYYRIKDGKRRALLFLPRSQVTERGDVQWLNNQAVKLPVTVSTYPDTDGNSAYLFLENGEIVPLQNGGEGAGTGDGGTE